MTIKKTMASLSMSKNFLGVSENHYNTNEDQNRGRSERASSLALPHNSLLDFYDKGQEQCNSVALLPVCANVVRRHSSHSYPMLEEKSPQQHHLQHQQQLSQQRLQNAATLSLINYKTFQQQQPEQQQQQQRIAPNQNILLRQPYQNQTYHFQQQQQQQQQFQQSIRKQTAITTVVSELGKSLPSHTNLNQLNTRPDIINNDEGKYLKMPKIESMPTPATPPPPIPKRTFRGKYVAWSASSVCSPTPSTEQTPTKYKQQQQHQQQPTQLQSQSQQQPHLQQQAAASCTSSSSPFNYPQNQSNGCGIGTIIGGSGISGYYPTAANEAPTLFVDIKTSARSEYSDADGISDDDRMSLENSVFDESMSSTPVKVGGPATNASKSSNVAFAAKTLAAALNASELSTVAKRFNRSSSSTIDSTATSSSGYGSSCAHSERFTSTSTTDDFRSRFSSVDTQSSLDGGLTDKTCDSALTKDSFKIERMTLTDATLQDYNNSFNNNDFQLARLNNNNNTLEGQLLNGSQQKLPLLTAQRKSNGPNNQQSKTIIQSTPPTHMLQQQSLKSKASQQPQEKKMSASTSTSSTASAGSVTSPLSASGSASGSLSTSATASNTAISPSTHTARTLIQTKRSVPPLPPARNQFSYDVDANNSKPPNLRNKWTKQKPPPIVYPKLHQRQDSTLSSDSFSVTSSPGYNSKTLMDAPLLHNAASINKNSASMRHQNSDNSFGMTASHYTFNGVDQDVAGAPSSVSQPQCNKFNYRQDSNLSSDTFSQTSSPGYNTRIMEAPLLPSSLSVKRLCGVPAPIICKQKLQNETIEEPEQTVPVSPLTKCVSTPASLQTIVRFQNGAPNTMSLQHRIINRRKSSNPYVTNGRLKFRLFQVLLNAFALLAIAGGLAAYFNAYPTIKFVNKTIINTIHVENISSYGKNPAPGTCLPIIVKFCQGPQIPYNYTVFPNYIGHFGQLETQVDLDAYEALVDVRCYELVSLFLCTLFVPKCGSTGSTVPPCKILCSETMRRCGFFFDVFGLSLPEYLNCKLFKDFESPEDCVGLDQVRDVMIASTNPKCDGFQCDQNRCIPKDYVCDGHLDCMDQADEANCERCGKDEIYCGDNRCVSAKHICDGVIDCPFGQDERNCIRLSERNGDLGKGILEVFRISSREWTPACVKNWDRAVSPTAVCSMLGYSSVNATSVVTQKTHRTLLTSVNVSTDIWKMYAKKRSNLMQEFSNCKPDEDYPIAELTCANYECGKVKRERHKPSRRIIGGSQAHPGSWPFLAAILGGPEKIFYCAGVLISDQWVLTASHCIGNHTVIDLEDWTIQLGVTRRNSFTYSGQKVKVKTVIPHPQYNTLIAHDNDIALFQLATRVAFHEHLLPVCLPPEGLKTLKSEQLCTVIGWGKREDKDPKSTYEPIINEVQVPIIRRQICDEWLDNLTVSDGMICAGYEDGGKDACQGDSGGPLLCPFPGDKDRWFVGGIVSWGIMCAHPKLPGVYANVIKYVPWIQEQMQKHSKPEEKISKYDAHPGGPDILSNMSPGPTKNKKTNNNNSFNRSPVDADYYDLYNT